MAFFQPGDAKTSGASETTPSPAAQAAAKFKAMLLGNLLNAAGSPRRPGFANFTGGASFPSPLPAGSGAGIQDLLLAMQQPNAFTSTSKTSGTQQGATPSVVSDLSQLAVLGMLVNKALGDEGQGGFGKIWDLIKNNLPGASTDAAIGSGSELPGVGTGDISGVNFTPDTSFDLASQSGDVPGVNFSTSTDTGGSQDDMIASILNLLGYA